jgi:hypothetical protein
LTFVVTDWFSRTYGRDEGEDIGERFKPNDSAPADPKEEGESSVREDEEIESPGAEETRQWKQAREAEALPKPKHGVEGEAFENVWDGSEPLERSRENP